MNPSKLLMVLLSFLVLAIALPSALAAPESAELIENGLKWGMDAPRLTGYNATSGNYTYAFSASVDSTGVATGFFGATFYIAEEVGVAPAAAAENTPSINLDAGISFLPLEVAFTGELEIDTTYFAVGCAVNAGGGWTFLPCEDSDTDPGTEVVFFSFTVMSDGELFLFTPGTHPLALGLIALGLDVSLSLFIIGMIPLIILSIFIFYANNGRANDNDLWVPFIVIVSANLFLRFWPAYLMVFLFLFVGWMLLRRTVGFGRNE